MRINHNISSMHTQNAMFKVNRDMKVSLERLSTGLRINRASDDAAGLGVSENLRTQVRGTAQAMRNAQDGIAAISIAEGAANEISDILQRMRELAVQSANDTLTSTERAYTNQEYQQLISEIDRIAEVTNYNGMKLISSSGTTEMNASVSARMARHCGLMQMQISEKIQLLSLSILLLPPALEQVAVPLSILLHSKIRNQRLKRYGLLMSQLTVLTPCVPIWELLLIVWNTRSITSLCPIPISSLQSLSSEMQISPSNLLTLPEIRYFLSLEYRCWRRQICLPRGFCSCLDNRDFQAAYSKGKWQSATFLFFYGCD